MDFNVKKYKVFIDVFSDYTLQLTLRNFLRFWYSIKEEYAYLSGKPSKILLPFPDTYLWGQIFFNIPQPKQHVTTDWM